MAIHENSVEKDTMMSWSSPIFRSFIETKVEVENVLSYLKTKFFRALVAIRKQDQGSSRAVYHYVPMQDFSKPWTDEELYKHFNLSKDEITFIEKLIKTMEWIDESLSKTLGWTGAISSGHDCRGKNSLQSLEEPLIVLLFSFC